MLRVQTGGPVIAVALRRARAGTGAGVTGAGVTCACTGDGRAAT